MYRHTEASCLHRAGLVCVMIPKNGMNTLHHFLKSWHHSLISEALARYPNPQVVAVIRNPIDRWIAGIAQYAYAAPYIRKEFGGFDLRNPKLVKYIFEKIVVDTHTEFQHMFLAEVSQHTLIPMENFSRIFEWFEERGYSGSRCHENKAPANLPRYRIRNNLKKFLVNHPEHQERLRIFYAQDIELYEKTLAQPSSFRHTERVDNNFS